MTLPSAWPFDPLPMFGYDLAVVDPPWLYSLYSAKGEAKAPQAHYACMDLAAIKALPVGQLCGMNSTCLLWTCAPLLDRAFEVLTHWGFVYKSRISWAKTTVSGKRRWGPGYWVRTLHEDILIGAIGAPVFEHALPSLFDGIAREHSRKPDEFYKLVESFAPNARRCDLFARQSRPGWDVWGNESTKFDVVASDDEREVAIP